jgi:DNA-binding NarL/FixJ family response regulator
MATKKAIKIKAGAATKFKKVKFDVARIMALYKSGKPVAQIALAIGYPANTGNNRVRNILIKAGVYKKAA